MVERVYSGSKFKGISKSVVEKKAWQLDQQAS